MIPGLGRAVVVFTFFGIHRLELRIRKVVVAKVGRPYRTYEASHLFLALLSNQVAHT